MAFAAADQPRNPIDSPLYGIVAGHLETLLVRQWDLKLIGTKLPHHAISSHLETEGMGEVYPPRTPGSAAAPTSPGTTTASPFIS